MFKTLANAWKVPELRKKLLYTLLLLVIFRFGSHITAPGVQADLDLSAGGIASTVNIITGGAFASLSIFAMSISPYITSSIVVQLLTFAIPSLERLSKEGGEEGRKKITQYTRYGAVILAAVEAFGIYSLYKDSGVFITNGVLTPLLFILTLTAGSTLLMWLAEQITTRGIGNGTSLLIFAGIVSSIDSAALTLFDMSVNMVENELGKMVIESINVQGLITSIVIIIAAIILIAGVVWVTEAERRVPVQYAKRVVGRKMYGGQNTHIPMKLAMAGVMPVIFAMSFMQMPAMIMQLVNPNIAEATGIWAGLYKIFAFTSLQNLTLIDSTTGAFEWGTLGFGIAHIVIYLLLIVGFTFFYTMGMAFNPIEVSNNLKKNGGFIPGIRAGKPTSDYLASILKYITTFGAMFLAIIAVLPILVQFTGLQLSFGGTAILIVVGVALESIKQLESQMLTRHYKGFLE